MKFELGMDNNISNAVDLIQTDRLLGMRRLQALAEAGNQSAIVYLGLYLSEDSETEEEAEKWLRTAAQFGSPDAAWNLALIERARGNESEMRAWIDRAVDFGEPDAAAVKNRGYNFGEFFAKLR